MEPIAGSLGWWRRAFTVKEQAKNAGGQMAPGLHHGKLSRASTLYHGQQSGGGRSVPPRGCKKVGQTSVVGRKQCLPDG